MCHGGAERVAALLSNRWAEDGVSVTLMPTFSGRSTMVFPVDPRVKLDFLADRTRQNTHTPVGKIQKLWILRKTIEEIRPDVVLSFLTNVNITAILATYGLKVRVVVSERTYPPAYPLPAWMTWLRQRTYAQADAVVLQTELGRAWLRESCPRAAGHVIPNPVLFPAPSSGPVHVPTNILPAERRVILAAGRLAYEKGFDILIKAYASIAADFPEWDLVILGEGTERPPLELLAHKMGLGNRVYLMGVAGNVSQWYERAELYVLSSHFEGFPNALLEAMAHGLAVISVDCKSGPRDIVRHGENGILVTPESGVEGLAHAMEALLLDPLERIRLAKAAREVRQRFSVEKIVQQWNTILWPDHEKASLAPPV